MLPEELSELESRFGSPISKHVIPLKDGMQAYVATFFGDPQLAKKDPSRIFTDDGGSFSKILQSNITAEKFRDAYELSRLVSEQVDRFKRLKRKRYADDSERKHAYIQEIGSVIEPVFSELDVAVPQITVFATAYLYQKHKHVSGDDLASLTSKIVDDPGIVWQGVVELISSRKTLGLEKSWPTLLKSGTFYRDAVSALQASWPSLENEE